MTATERGGLEGRVLPRSDRVFLRHPERGDVEEFLRMVTDSVRLHRPWVYLSESPETFFRYVDRSSGERELGCLICRVSDGAVVGAANLSEIARGAFQSAYLSFYGRAGFTGQGLVREGVGLLLRHAFGELRLHRLEANVQPGNRRSLALVEFLGFRKEGFSPRYLKIGGRWRDHERWAILAEEWARGRGVWDSRNGD